MISRELNERLTRVGPGTPMGNLLRRYWHPVAAVAELQEWPTKKVRLLGEDLVLYRDLKGRWGFIEEQCPHRKASLEYGIPEEDGIRCPYHGWKFDQDGQCTEQPAEPPESTFKDRVTATCYPVQELGGFIFAYLGPEPAPLLPRYDLLVKENTVRQIGMAVLPCNWLQIMENSVDPTHAEWLHGHYFKYVNERAGEKVGNMGTLRRHVKIGFDRFEYGIIKRRILEGQSEEHDDWKVGHPLIFPTMLKVGNAGRASFQFRVPVDDTHTIHYWYLCVTPDEGIDIEIPRQDVVPFYTVDYRDENGRFKTNTVDGQDIMCWITQGAISDRTTERLGVADKGIIMFRQLLQEQMDKVDQGEDPMCVVRDPDKNQIIDLPQEDNKILSTGTGFKGWRLNYAPEMLDFLQKYEEALKGKSLI